MRYRSSFATMLAMLFLPALFSCASRGAVEPLPDAAQAADIPADAIPIQVENNVPAAPSVTIFLSDGIGTRRLLGTVAPGQTETFIIEQAIAPGPYRLIAEESPGRGIASRPIHLTIRDGVRWILGTNTITSLLSDAP